MAQLISVRPLTREEKDMLWIALNMRNNYIQTGDACLDAATAYKMGNKEARAKINVLDTDQMRLIVASTDFINKIMQGKVFLAE